MGKHIIHISNKEAATTNVATLLEHVRSGAEVVLDDGTRLLALPPAAQPSRRTISECVALLPEDSTATVDPDFSKDVAAAIESHSEPLNPPAWD